MHWRILNKLTITKIIKDLYFIIILFYIQIKNIYKFKGIINGLKIFRHIDMS